MLSRAQSSIFDWQKCYGGARSDQAGKILPTPDGGYIIVGNTNSNDGDLLDSSRDFTNMDGWVLKLSGVGEVEWQTTVGGADVDQFSNGILTSDGGCLITGLTHSPVVDGSANHGDYDGVVAKISKSGAIEWVRCLGGTGYDQLAGAVEDRSEMSGYLIAGLTFSDDGSVSGNHGNGDIWILRLNLSGDLTWQHCYGGSGIEWGGNIIQTADFGFLVSATTSSNDGDVTGFHTGPPKEYPDVWLLRLNSSGSLRWQKCLGGTGSDMLPGVVPASDGGFFLCGSTNSLDGDVSGVHSDTAYGQTDAWVVRLDNAGELKWQRCYGGSSTEAVTQIILEDDGRMVLVGSTSSLDGDVVGKHGSGVSGNLKNIDGWLLLLDTNGSFRGERCFGGSGGDNLFSICKSHSGGYVLAGSTSSKDGDVVGLHPGGYSDAWVVALNENSGVGPAIGKDKLVSSDMTNLAVFPNPAADRIQCELPSDVVVTRLACYDILGVEHRLMPIVNHGILTADVHSLIDGVYTARVAVEWNGRISLMNGILVVVH